MKGDPSHHGVRKWQPSLRWGVELWLAGEVRHGVVAGRRPTLVKSELQRVDPPRNGVGEIAARRLVLSVATLKQAGLVAMQLQPGISVPIQSRIGWRGRGA